MKILSTPYIKIKYNKEGECRESLKNTGDVMWVKIDKMFVLGDICLISPSEVNETKIAVRAKNNMYIFSLDEIATFFETASATTVTDVEVSCEFKTFIIDDFNNEPISENEECLLLEPSISDKEEYNTYKASIKSIKSNLVIINIRYSGNKISIEANLAIDPNNNSRFLIKKITKGE